MFHAMRILAEGYMGALARGTRAVTREHARELALRSARVCRPMNKRLCPQTHSDWYALATMDATMRDILSGHRKALDAIDPYRWSEIEEWTAQVRPLIVEALHRHIDGFDRVTRRPAFVQSPRFMGSRGDNFAEAAATDEAANRKISTSAKAALGRFLDTLLALPLTNARQELGASRHNYYGGVQMGDKYTTNIKNSNVGAAAIGAEASATGNVSVSQAARVSQADYEAHIRNAQKSLIDDQDLLEEISKGLYEGIGQVLRIARQIGVDQLSIKDTQTKMKATLDEVWAEQVAPKLKGKSLPATLEVAKTLLSSPMTAGIAKTWLGGT
jgi:hypothetical protein